MPMQKIDNPMQAVTFVIALFIAIANFSLMLVYVGKQREFPSWSFVFYVGFFWFFWAYRRSEGFRKPLFFRFSLSMQRISLFIFLALVVLTYYFAKEFAVNVEIYEKYSSLFALISSGYIFIASIAIFGETFLGRFRKLFRD